MLVRSDLLGVTKRAALWASVTSHDDLLNPNFGAAALREIRFFCEIRVQISRFK